MRTALLMLLVPCLRSLADAGAPHGLQCRLRLRGGGRRAAAGGGVRVRRPDPGACGTIRSSLAEAEDGGNAQSVARLPGWADTVSYTVSQPDPGSTLTQIRWPMCFGKHSAMRLRGGGRRAAAGGGVRVRRPDPGAFGTIRSSLAEAEDGGPPPAPLPPHSLPPLSR